jgi:hypothetical protein
MIKFIKNLLGFGSAEPQETVKEILTPPAPTPTPAVEYIPPAKPVAKVRAISEGPTKGGNGSVKPASQQSKKPKAPAKPQSKGKPRAKRK